MLRMSRKGVAASVSASLLAVLLVASRAAVLLVSRQQIGNAAEFVPSVRSQSSAVSRSATEPPSALPDDIDDIGASIFRADHEQTANESPRRRAVSRRENGARSASRIKRDILRRESRTRSYRKFRGFYAIPVSRA